MKNKKRVFVGTLVLIILVLLCYKIFFRSEYENHVSSFSKVSAPTVEDKIQNKEDFILYIGRETCPECVHFVPVLSEVAGSEKIKVLYLDSTNTEKSKELKEFRDKYEIMYVPSLLIFKEGKVNFPKIPSNKDEMINILKGYGIIE